MHSILNDAQTHKVALGDAVSTQMVGGLETIRFADGSGATKTPSGWSYFWSNGQQARTLTVHQQAHDAMARGSTLRQFGDAYVERKGNAEAARAGYQDHLSNAWRG